MKSFFNIILLIFISGNVFSQTFNLEVRNQVKIGNTVEFEIYMTNTSGSNIYIASTDFTLDFAYQKFTNPTFTVVTRGSSGSKFRDLRYGNFSPNITNNRLILNLNAPAIEDQETLELLAENISASGTYIGKFRISNLTDHTGSLNLAWALSGFNNTVIYRFDESNFNQVAITDNGNYVAPANLSLVSNQLSFSFTGDGTVGNEYKVNLKSATTSTQQANNVGFYVYYNTAGTTFGYFKDDALSGAAGFNWGTANRSVTTGEIGSFTKDNRTYNRRFVYTNNRGSQTDDNWPINSSEGVNIISLHFGTIGAGNTIYFEPISSSSFTDNLGNAYNYSITGATHPLGTNNVLPVTLTSFTATLQNQNKVLLKWATASELNNEQFMVERSADAKVFETIDSVKGNGTSQVVHTYATTDHAPLPGTSYYRLKQVDFDGKFEYSKVVPVTNGAAVQLAIKSAQPNPFTNQAIVDFILPAEGAVTISINDMVGRAVKTKVVAGKPGLNSYKFEDLNNLQKGVYFITLRFGTANASYKLMKNN